MISLTNPNVYILGGKPKVNLTTIDIEGQPFIPTESRLTIKQPDGTLFTVSGANLVVASGLSYYIFHPEQIGWHEYEGWVRDGHGFEDTDSNGFEITDRVF